MVKRNRDGTFPSSDVLSIVRKKLYNCQLAFDFDFAMNEIFVSKVILNSATYVWEAIKNEGNVNFLFFLPSQLVNVNSH